MDRVPKKGTFWLLKIQKLLPEKERQEFMEYVTNLEQSQDRLVAAAQSFCDKFQFKNPEWERQS